MVNSNPILGLLGHIEDKVKKLIVTVGYPNLLIHWNIVAMDFARTRSGILYMKAEFYGEIHIYHANNQGL